jgi:protoheme IX farnesyltransferase
MIERDYGRGDVPMMPVRYGARSTQIHIYWYVLHLIALTLFIYAIGLFGNLYLITMIALAVGLLWYASRLLVDASKTAAKRLYRFSSYYLLLLFLSMMLDAVIQ